MIMFDWNIMIGKLLDIAGKYGRIGCLGSRIKKIVFAHDFFIFFYGHQKLSIDFYHLILVLVHTNCFIILNLI